MKVGTKKMVSLQKNAEHILIKVIRFLIDAEMANSFSEELRSELDTVMEYALRHDMSHLVVHALEVGGTLSNNISPEFRFVKAQAVYRYLRLDQAYQQICVTLENSGIPYVPLKGAVMREYYPEPWMRTSCDVDILIHENDLERAVDSLVFLGWKMKRTKNYHDISLFSPTGIHLELHFSIKENLPNMDDVLEKVWDYCSLVSGKQYEYRQTNEYLFFHLVAHMAYHFLNGGCGIRAVLDVWLLLNRVPMNTDVLRNLCTEAKLERFSDNVVALSHVWFGHAEHTLITQKLEEFILNGGVYGETSQKVILGQARSGGKVKYLLQRIIMPYTSLKIKYPLLETHKWMTPMFQIIRWIQLFTKGRLRRSLKELNDSKRNSYTKIDEHKDLLAYLGIFEKSPPGIE